MLRAYHKDCFDGERIGSPRIFLDLEPHNSIRLIIDLVPGSKIAKQFFKRVMYEGPKCLVDQYFWDEFSQLSALTCLPFSHLEGYVMIVQRPGVQKIEFEKLSSRSNMPDFSNVIGFLSSGHFNHVKRTPSFRNPKIIGGGLVLPIYKKVQKLATDEEIEAYSNQLRGEILNPTPTSNPTKGVRRVMRINLNRVYVPGRQNDSIPDKINLLNDYFRTRMGPPERRRLLDSICF